MEIFKYIKTYYNTKWMYFSLDHPFLETLKKFFLLFSEPSIQFFLTAPIFEAGTQLTHLQKTVLFFLH